MHRRGLRRAFELFVRPLVREVALADPPSPPVAGTARTAVSGAGGTTREEYRITEPAVPGGVSSRTLSDARGIDARGIVYDASGCRPYMAGKIALVAV
jgi:hypothetical protein